MSAGQGEAGPSRPAQRAISLAGLAPEWGLVVGLAATLGLIYLLEPAHSFFTPYTLRTLVHNAGLYGVLALGAAIVIIAGGIDLSVGSMVALSAVVCGKLITDWLPRVPGSPGASWKIPLAMALSGGALLGLGRASGLRRLGPAAGGAVVVLLGIGFALNARGEPVGPTLAIIGISMALSLLLGLGVGLSHALMITALRLPPFIATLATMAGLRSLALILSGNQSITLNLPAFRAAGADNRYTVAIFGALAILASLTMGRTVLGRHLYALGGNEAAARLSGLPIARLKAIAYGTSGALAALGGLLFAGDSGQASGTMGVAFELVAITAAVVGGCSLAGGVGSIRGTVLGLLLIQVVIKGTGLTVRRIDSTQIEGLVLGAVVVLAVAFNQRFRARG